MIRRTRRLMMALAVCIGLAVPAVAVLPAQSAFAQTCAQPTHVWFGDENNGEQFGDLFPAAPQPGLINAQSGDRFFFTGIVEPNTPITYVVTFRGNTNPQIVLKWNAGGNCVANQVELNIFNNSIFHPSIADVTVNYEAVDVGGFVTEYLGTIEFP